MKCPYCGKEFILEIEISVKAIPLDILDQKISEKVDNEIIIYDILEFLKENTEEKELRNFLKEIYDLDDKEIDMLIEKLKIEGLIYEPKEGILKLV